METIATDHVIARVIALYADVPGGLLPLLHDLQNELGHIPSAAVPQIAQGMGLSRAEIHGVISFYHDFRNHSVGRHVVQICRAEACQAMGCRSLETHAKTYLGIDFGETTGDGAITLEPVYCLGNCACSPSVRVDDAVHGRVDERRFDQLVGQLKGGVSS